MLMLRRWTLSESICTYCTRLWGVGFGWDVGFSTIYLRLDFHHSAGIPKTSCFKIRFSLEKLLWLLTSHFEKQ